VSATGPQRALDLAAVVRFADLALDALGRAREEVDALNVYPVPDGDTGTNMFLTFEAAHSAMLTALGLPPDPAERQDLSDDPDRLGPAVEAFAHGALLGARGNSGVIFSELVGAFCKHLAGVTGEDRPAVVLAEGLTRAAEAAVAAVGTPVEGTILSVARAAAVAATGATEDADARAGQVLRAAASAAREALARTPDQLAVLREAGVVDAGGRGLCVVLDAAETAVTGRRPVSAPTALGVHAIPVPLSAPVPSADLHPDGPAYEVMYLLDTDAAGATVPALRARLAALGDSLVVVGGDGLWNVHVHVDDVGAAIEAGLEAGRPYRVRVTHFAEQRGAATATAAGSTGNATGRTRPATPGGPGGPGARPGRAVVAVAAGAGLGEIFGQAGAVVVHGGPGLRPTTGQVLEAVTVAGAAEVIVLPNDRDSVAACEAAARSARETTGFRVAVVPTHAQVQGLAAMAVHEPGRSFEEDLVAMAAAARHARSGGVRVASRRAMTTAGPCEPGDVLGAVEGDFVLVGQDLFSVATGILERLLGGGGELVTLVAGAPGWSGSSADVVDDPLALAERCAAYLQDRHPTVDVVVYAGGQERYPILVGVE